ncbi:thioesterase family protein [Aeromonas sobria]|uniref:thioesterase family protein n=1 Tax=Aeromonas sobria TaxID=646 RepID=UPI001396BF4F|nr:thioesterase family protein [Aeromonas sobria]EKP0262963.1 thioesterase family protein [Aeromonas sobria]
MKQMLKKMALSGIANLFAERMPFNKLIGMQVTHYDFDKVELRIKMDDKLIGNPFHNILHGGVTASLLDVAGGMIVAASCIDELEEFSPSYLKERFARLGTIDLRVDYLRPGRGNEFIATAHIIRAGSKVAVARMELHNEEGTHIAFGTGTYLVG